MKLFVSCRFLKVQRKKKRRRNRKMATRQSDGSTGDQKQSDSAHCHTCLKAKHSGSLIMDCMNAERRRRFLLYTFYFIFFSCKYLNMKPVCNFKINLFSVFLQFQKCMFRATGSDIKKLVCRLTVLSDSVQFQFLLLSWTAGECFGSK